MTAPGNARRNLYTRANLGIVTPATATAAGTTPKTVRRWARDELWDRPFRGALVLPGVDLDATTRMAAAVAAIGAPIAMTGWSAAYLRGLVGAAPTTIDVVVPADRRPARHGVRARRTRAWHAPAIVTIGGLPVVPWAWMLADLAGEASLDLLIGWAFDGLHSGGLERGELVAEVDRRGRFAGRGNVVELARRLEPDGSESGFEHHARRRMRRDRFDPDDEQVTVVVGGRNRRIDVPWARYQVGVECLSFRYHGHRDAFEQDTHRRNDFVVDGAWRVLELTWRMLETDWAPFARRLGTVLRDRGWRPRRR